MPLRMRDASMNPGRTEPLAARPGIIQSSMFLHGIGTAVPERRYSKSECWDAFTASSWFGQLSERSRTLAQLVLARDNGIEFRHLAVGSLDEVFAIEADVLHSRFATHAPSLACAAAERALADAGLGVDAIGAVVVTTCTGYLCPGLSSYIIERLRMNRHVFAFDLVGQGCAGALPNWQLCHAVLASQQCAHVLSISVEVCSAAMYLDDDPGVLISACLFGDGAGAAILSSARPEGRRSVEFNGSVSMTNPAAREALRFEQRGGLLRNILTRDVPRLAALHVHDVLSAVLQRAHLEPSVICEWILHAGGRDVLLAVSDRLGVPIDAFRHSREALREYGNLSSAFVYFVLQAALQAKAPAGRWWMSSFGAGFSCHGALLSVE